MMKLVFVVLAILAVASAQYVYNYNTPYAYSAGAYPAVKAYSSYGYAAPSYSPYYARNYAYVG